MGFVRFMLGLWVSVFFWSPVSAEEAAPLEKAEQLLNSRNAREAFEILSSYRPAEKELSRYHALFAQTLEAKGAIPESIEQYRIAFLFAQTPQEKEKLLFSRALAYEKMKWHSEAALSFTVFLRLFPNSEFVEQARLHLAECRLRLGQYHEALTQFRQAGSSPRARAGEARALHELGMAKEAHAFFLSLIEKEQAFLNKSEETRYGIGENFRVMGRLADARIYLGSVQEAGLRERAALGLGLIETTEGKYDMALRRFAEAQKSTDLSVKRRALLATAEVLQKAGKTEDAVRPLREIVQHYPYTVEYDRAILELADLSRLAGKREEAVSLLKELLFRRSLETTTLDEIEMILHDALSQNRDEFVRLWNSVGQWLLDPSRSSALLTFAAGLKNAGKPFLSLCSWLIKYGQNNVKEKVQLLLAEFYANIGDSGTALTYMEQMNNHNRNAKDNDYLKTTARIYFAGGAQKKAAEAILSMTEPSEEDIVLLLKTVRFLNVQDRSKVFDAVERTLKKITGTVRVYVLFGDLLSETGRAEDARRYYAAAVSAKISRKDEDARKDVEWARHRLGMINRNKEQVEKTGEMGSSLIGRFKGVDLRADSLLEKAKEAL